MIDAGSFIGFVLAFALLGWTLSAVAGAVVIACRRRLATAGAAAERTAAAAALVVPPTLAFAAVSGVALAQLGGADHCEEHGHHLHLCLAHGGAWANHVLPVVVVAAFASALAIRIGASVVQMMAARRIVRTLRRVGDVHLHDGCEVIVAPSPYRLSLTAGLVTPRVYVSTAVWDALDREERAAVLAHETAHARAHDVPWRLFLGAFAALGAPRIAARLLQTWGRATERLRDHDAARATEPAVVGDALLKVARVPATPRLAASAGLIADEELAGRVEALLDDRPAGQPAARWIARFAWIVAALALAAAVLCTGPLHHALETLLSPL